MSTTGRSRREVRRQLYDYNVAADRHRRRRHARRDAARRTGRLVAGLYGWTWGGCAFVDLLWVDEPLPGRPGSAAGCWPRPRRRPGRAGCTQVLLSTHGFQAPGFYRARGYRETGRFENYPTGSYQLQLAKQLD